MNRVELRWENGADGRPECWNGEDSPVWAVYWPPPGQSGSPGRVVEVRPGGFIGTQSAMQDCTVYKSKTAAYEAAWE